jgi:hypothetical protein
MPVGADIPRWTRPTPFARGARRRPTAQAPLMRHTSARTPYLGFGGCALRSRSSERSARVGPRWRCSSSSARCSSGREHLLRGAHRVGSSEHPMSPSGTTPISTRLNTYTGYSISCAAVWAVILVVARRRLDYPTRNTLRLVCSGWWMGWTSASIARVSFRRRRRSSPGPRKGSARCRSR